MKNLLLSLAFFCTFLCSVPSFAQQKGADKQQKTEMRSAHMASILGLNDANTARFKALYAKSTNEIRAARQKYSHIRVKKGERLTDQQVKTNLDRQFALSQSILDIRKKYYAEYSKFLTPRQIERLYELEKKNAEKLREMAGKRGGGAHKGPQKGPQKGNSYKGGKRK